MKKKLYASALATLITIACGSALVAHRCNAQSVDPKTIPEVSTDGTSINDADFAAQTEIYEERPENDKNLNFSISIPKTWARIGNTFDDPAAPDKTATNLNVRVSKRVLGSIVKYVGEVPFEQASYLEVDALELDYEVTARNWLLEHALKNGYVLQGMKEYDDWNVEVLYTHIIDATPYVVRTRAIINGPRIVLIAYYVPEARFEKEKALQDRVVDSFKLLNPNKVNLESKRTYAFLDLVRFDYPAIWRLIAPNISSIDGMDAKLINTKDEKSLQGEINVRIVSRELETSLPLEVQYLKEKIRAMGLEVGDLMRTEDKFTFHSHINFARVEIYNAKPKDKRVQDHEYWLAILAEDRYYYIVSMLTPSEKSDFFTWARNAEAYEIVVESIRP